MSNGQTAKRFDGIGGGGGGAVRFDFGATDLGSGFGSGHVLSKYICSCRISFSWCFFRFASILSEQ
jgi:hypothetical protein